MKHIYLFLLFSFWTAFVFAETTDSLSANKVVTPNLKYHLHFNKIYDTDLKQLHQFLNDAQFKEAQSLLSKIQEKIFYDFQDQLKVCFPNKYQGLKIVENSKLSQGEFEKVDFGVFFTQRYSNDDGKSLEINIVDAEQSAQDYKDLILKPELIEGLENTSLVSYDSFKAIQTIDSKVKHHEQNILLSNL